MPTGTWNLGLQHLCMSLMSRTVEAFRASKANSSWKRKLFLLVQRVEYDSLQVVLKLWEVTLAHASLFDIWSFVESRLINLATRKHRDLIILGSEGRPRNQRRRPEKRRMASTDPRKIAEACMPPAREKKWMFHNVSYCSCRVV